MYIPHLLKVSEEGKSLKPNIVLRILAKISKMPVLILNSNSNISAHPDLATHLLQILIPSMFNSLLCQKGHVIY